MGRRYAEELGAHGIGDAAADAGWPPDVRQGAGVRNLFLATGHAMLGVTLAPVTGELMVDLMTGERNAAATPFDPGRFRW